MYVYNLGDTNLATVAHMLSQRTKRNMESINTYLWLIKQKNKRERLNVVCLMLLNTDKGKNN